MFERFKVRKATVEADSLKAKPGKHHQTNTHNATTYVAENLLVGWSS